MKGTSWEREGSPFRPTKIRDKPDRTGEVQSSESQKPTTLLLGRGRVQGSDSKNVQRRRHLCKFSPQRPRHSPQPTAKERFTASIPAQRDASFRQVDFAVGAGTQRKHAPRRVSARGRGVWTLAEASVECRVMSGATAADADDTSDTEEREGAGGGDGEVQHRSGFRAACGTARIHSQRE